MALASQSSRNDRNASNSKGRGNSTLFISSIAAAAALAGAYWLMRSGDTGSTESSSLTRTASASEMTPEAKPSEPKQTALDTAIALSTEKPAAENAVVAEPTPSAPTNSAAKPPVNPAPTTNPTTTPTTAPTTNPTTNPGTPAPIPPTTLPPAGGVPTAPPAPKPTAEPAATPAATPAANPEAAPAKITPTDAPATAPSDAKASDTKAADTKAADTKANDTKSTDAKPTGPYFGNGFNGPNNGQAAGNNQAAPKAMPTAAVETALKEGLSLAATEPVKARALLSTALLSGSLSEPDAKHASDALAHIGTELFFTPVFNANDPTCFQYTIQSGDSLEKIVRRQKLGCDWRLVARLNNIKKPESIRAGQRIKLPKGPFSAVVTKRDYRIDLCVGAGSDRVVIASLPVGLGATNGMPTGRFRVRPGSKLLNPEWVHPVTGQHFDADDPKNPIGEHWLGLEGMDEANSKLAGYGIHGTIDIESIGNNRSLGCVRLLADDVAIVWESLADGADVEIRP